jgi:large repetitive protein
LEDVTKLACSPADAQGRQLLWSGAWNEDSKLKCDGGQGIHFVVTNINATGTTLQVSASDGETSSALTADLNFAMFGQEPISWSFEISSASDAFTVTYCLYSTWIPSPPSLTSISPDSGSSTGGDTVTITGTGFTGATDVDFGNTNAATMTVMSDTQIRVTSPAGSGTVDVTVITPAGTSAQSSADQFTYADTSQ